MTGAPALPIAGGCHSGEVRWRASAPPVAARTCWCGFCQRIGAAPAWAQIDHARPVHEGQAPV